MQPKDFTTRYTTWFADDDAYATQTLRGLIRASTTVIEANRNVLNALNVFPVPDGDTGTNMLLTLRNIEEQLDAHPASTFAETVNNMARAALLGARGNSGPHTRAAIPRHEGRPTGRNIHHRHQFRRVASCRNRTGIQSRPATARRHHAYRHP